MSLIESKPLIKRFGSRSIQPTLEEVSRGVHVTREMFGLGKSGESSFQAVMVVRDIIYRERMGESITEQERRVAEMNRCSSPTPNDPQRCNGIPTGTVNCDWWGDETIVPVCSREHGDLVEESIQKDLRAEGRFSQIARNGWGRA